MGLISYIKEEIRVVRERDPAIRSSLEVFLYPSFRVILRYRLAHKLYLKKHYFLARWISQRAARKTGIEIHPGATIGKGLFIDHGHRRQCDPVSGRDPGRYGKGAGKAPSDPGGQCNGKRRGKDPRVVYHR